MFNKDQYTKQCVVSLLISLIVRYSVDICDAYVLKPFNFQCFEHDICQFPNQFCSSAEHERICLPCLPSVCARTDVPLQCLYNCSLAVDNAGDIGETDSNFHHIARSVGWFYLSICECVSIVILVIVLVNCRRMQRRMNAVLMNNSQSEGNSLINLEGAHSKENNNEDEGNAEQCYGERKLMHVPTTNSSIDGSYAPTTHLSKIETH